MIRLQTRTTCSINCRTYSSLSSASQRDAMYVIKWPGSYTAPQRSKSELSKYCSYLWRGLIKRGSIRRERTVHRNMQITVLLPPDLPIKDARPILMRQNWKLEVRFVVHASPFLPERLARWSVVLLIAPVRRVRKPKSGFIESNYRRRSTICGCPCPHAARHS